MLTLASAGLPVGIRATYPHLAAYEALRVPPQVRRQLDPILTGQVAVAAFDPRGELVDVTGVQIAEVLDDAVRRAAAREPRRHLAGVDPTVSRVGTHRQVRVPAPDPAGRDGGAPVAMRRDRRRRLDVAGSRRGGTPPTSSRSPSTHPRSTRSSTNDVTDPYSLAPDDQLRSARCSSTSTTRR